MNEDAAREYLGIADDDYSVGSYKRANAFVDENKDKFFKLFSEHFFSLWD